MNDELERVREYRSDLPGPDPQVTGRARDQLMHAITSTEPAPARRAPATPTPKPSTPARQAPARRTAPPARRRTFLRRPAVRVGFGLAAAVAAAVVAVMVSSGSSSSNAAAAELQRLARVAEHQSPVQAPGPGQYLYTASVQTNESISQAGRHGICRALVPQTRRLWVGNDGSGRLLELNGLASPLTAADRRTCADAGPGAVSGPNTSDLYFAPRCFTLGPASGLHGNFDDPRTLLAQMAKLDGGPPGPGEAFVHVGDFLRETDASPGLRAAIFRAAVTIPGVRAIHNVTDRLGRRGIGLARTNHDGTDELIFDPRDSALLGERMTDAEGAVVESDAYRRSVIVDHIPGTGPTKLGPACAPDHTGYPHTLPGGAQLQNGAPITRH